MRTPKLTEGQKAALASGLLTYWRELLMVLLLVAVALMGWRWQAASGEAEALRARVDLSRTIADEEERLAEVRQREADLYPAIEAKLKELAEADKALARRRAELDNKATKKKIAAKVEALTTDQLAEAFKAKGYPCWVVEERKP